MAEINYGGIGVDNGGDGSGGRDGDGVEIDGCADFGSCGGDNVGCGITVMVIGVVMMVAMVVVVIRVMAFVAMLAVVIVVMGVVMMIGDGDCYVDCGVDGGCVIVIVVMVVMAMIVAVAMVMIVAVLLCKERHFCKSGMDRPTDRPT